MDSTDAFFTQTIVGAPRSVLLGTRMSAQQRLAHGLQVDMTSGRSALSQWWHDWVVLSHANDRVGVSRLRPGPLRRTLERHALVIALAGLLTLVAGLVLIVMGLR